MEKWGVGGGGGLVVLPQNIFVFLSSLARLDFYCNFSMIFGQKGTFCSGSKPSVEGPTQEVGGGGRALSPPVYMLKEALF